VHEHGTAREDGTAREVDALGLPCPRPVIELARAVEDVAVGSRVVLLADDPAVAVDVPVWVRLKRHRMVGQSRATDSGAWRFEIERRH
jgi:TusA-related sulfurtransferase